MKKKKEKKENSERWLLTYSDLITLLMILFVVLYAMSTVDQAKYNELTQSLQGALGDKGKTINGSMIPSGSGILEGETPGSGTDTEYQNQSTENLGSSEGSTGEDGTGEDGTGETGESETGDTDSSNEFTNLRTELLQAIKDDKFKDKLYITIEDKGLVISVSNDILFESGQADVKDDMKETLEIIARLINRLSNPIQVEGYTDNIPVHNSRYTSNWQLSAERAANVVQYLIDNYDVKPQRLTAIGYGEYSPVASNDTAEGRERNRRISITILYSDSAK
jgi:chemotaxis protein MotB